MRRAWRAVVIWMFVASAVLAAQSRLAPAPETWFGFKPGTDYKLANYDQTIDYFKKLAAASKNIRLVETGRTSQGRPMYFALISSTKNLDHIERYREILQRLAHPQGLSDETARQLARDGKPIVHIDGGLHATEVAGPQHTPLLAYELLSKAHNDDPAIKTILDNVILMLWPTINPDGQQMVADWYMSNVGTPYELSPVPQLYQEYVGHDNNRDAYMLNMIESRVIEQTWRDWEPSIVYVHHQSSPFPTRIWLPPFSEPIGSDAPFLMSREVNMIGMAIAKALEERGQVGATHMGLAFDAWYPGYVDYAPNFKNVPAFWTETALFQYATPREYTLADFPESYRDLRPQSLYSSPWRPGWWRLGDAVAYMQTASLAVLEYAAKYRESLLFNRYAAGRDQIKRGRTEGPFAYVVPADQRDPVAAVELLRRLAFSGIRVSQLTAVAPIDGVTYPAGTWVVPTDQEFAAMARQVLNAQKYPDLRQYPGGPPVRPYDAAGWSLPMQMGVRVIAAASPLTGDVRASMKLLGPLPDPEAKPRPYNATAVPDSAAFDSVPGVGFDTNANAAAIVPPKGTIIGAGPDLIVDPGQNNAYRAINRAWNAGATIARVAGEANGGMRFAIRGLPPPAQDDLVNTLALAAERATAGGVAMKRPRIGLFRPWTSSMDEGWTRWVMEQYGFSLVTLRPADFHSPLAEKVDVVILAEDARLPVDGGNRGRGGAPAPGGRNGGRATRPEYADTVSAADLEAFERFIRDGGTLVCLGSASTYAIGQFKLPVKNVVAGLRPEEFYLRGSIVEVMPDRSHPVMAGMPEKAAVFVDSSPVFETLEGFTGRVLARYQESGSPLLSGYLIGESFLNGKAAALDVALDKGHVVLLGFRPQWRGQPFGTFKVLFNAALFAE
ncbi:MAG TPA: M14 metallopeptidase family protein [Vicinamibacterales bacterium]|nr:M14 metallopeptidase family protein [Vicinamibacterales bacterium]